jgi:hypothetical protein
MSNKEIQFVKTFESYVAIYEKSNLNDIKLPQEMIKLLHTKEEHINSKYPKIGHMYRGGSVIPLPHEFHAFDAKTPLPEPINLTGLVNIGTPFGLDTDKASDLEPKPGAKPKEYTDLIWFLRSIPYAPKGECRILITHPKSEFYMLVYGKKESVSATGSQYAIISWNPKLQKAIDYGFSELTTQGVDEDELRKVHDKKGGNTTGKVQEHVKSRIPGYGSKKLNYTKPENLLQAYRFEVNPSQEAKATRETRREAKGESNSSKFLRIFANRFSGTVNRLNMNIKSRIVTEIDNSSRSYNQVDPEIITLAETLGAGPGETVTWLYKKFRDFRKELFEEGRNRTPGAISAYDKTAGIELEDENTKNPSWDRYQVKIEKFDPTTKYDITKSLDPEQPADDETEPEKKIRKAQPEKYKVPLPIAGEYASIPIMIKKHTLDGLIGKFSAFIVTGKIKLPDVSLQGILGISGEDDDNKFKRTSKLEPGKDDSNNVLF